MFHGMGRYAEGFWSLNHWGYGGYTVMATGLVLLVLLLIWIFKRGNESSSGRNESPLELLQNRFINGEISQEEFILKKEILDK